MPSTRGRAAVLALALLALAGCAKFDAALGKQWVDVSFKPGTSVAQVARIRAACSDVPNVTADPIPRNEPALEIVSTQRFDTTKASDGNVAELTTCLSRFPAVATVTPGDTSDMGG